MTLYRAVNHLSGHAKRGELTTLAHLNAEQIARLERLGAVAPVAAPPLAELPGWEGRAAKLAAIGIDDAAQFLEADPAAVRKALRVKAETVMGWREQVLGFLKAD